MSFTKKEKGILSLALIGAGLLVLFRGQAVRALAKILPVQRIRMDPRGDGHFGSGRTGHTHQGVDLLVNEGDPVASPIDGRIVRYSYAYTDSAKWRNVVIQGEGIEVKIMYATLAPGLTVGDPVRRGQIVGKAQAISDRYGGPPMLDHLHVEARRIVGAELLNPERLLALT